MNEGGGYLGLGGSEAKAPHKQLTQEQLQHLFTRLSSDEQHELQDALKSCSTEVLFTRGLPFATFVLGSVYYARTRLPPQYHFGPKGWPFYAIIGIGSLTAANIFGMGRCKERIAPKIDELWRKHHLDDAQTTYDALRTANRQRMNSGSSVASQARLSDSASTSSSYERAQRQPQSEWEPQGPVSERPPGSPFRQNYDEAPIYMSGTPSAGQPFGGNLATSAPSRMAMDSKTNRYGDEGFS